MYDLVFVTHLPAFYKVNLYNELSKNKKIFVLFISDGSEIRMSDFTKNEMNFDFEVINHGVFEKRNKLISSIMVLKSLKHIKFEKIIIGGWDLIEFWCVAFTHSRKNNVVVVESTRYESATDGLKGKIKRFFMRRVSIALCSGTPHRELVESLGFCGKVITTHGVGISNHVQDTTISHRYNGRYLYIGRLSSEKGLDFLVEYFNCHPDISLTIVGTGVLQTELALKANNNIHFKGYVKNSELRTVYSNHDVFILPSLSEPWGLVIEEALSYGLPVICSDNVGCNIDLVARYNSGVIFSAKDHISLSNAIEKIEKNYMMHCNYIEKIDFIALKNKQIESYNL